jgi:hypothetical protein
MFMEVSPENPAIGRTKMTAAAVGGAVVRCFHALTISKDVRALSGLTAEREHKSSMGGGRYSVIRAETPVAAACRLASVAGLI